MSDQSRQEVLSSLPDFLRISVERGLVEEHTARRIELFRRMRGLGDVIPVSRLLQATADPHLTFENFIPCKENSFAFELAKTVVRKSPVDLPYNPLYIYSDVGLGKTHILSAIANGCAPLSATMVNTADLEAEFERFTSLNVRSELREWMVSGDILLIDDIQLCEGKEDLQIEFFSAINHMFVKKGWVVISSDVPPTQLARIEARLISRLGSGAVVSLQMGDKAYRLAVLEQSFGGRAAPEDVREFLAEKIRTNVRALKAAAAQLMATSDATGADITLDLARALVLLPEEEQMVLRRSFALEPWSCHAEDESSKVVAQRFKEMLGSAENEEEQALALQIALGERIRQLREERAHPAKIERLVMALELVRGGDVKGAMKCLSA